MPPRRRQTASPAAVPSAALAASATRVTRRGGVHRTNRGADTNWQGAAWTYYDLIGELRYACSWVGNALSRARLYAARVTPTDNPSHPTRMEPATGAAAEAMAAFFAGPDGQAQALGLLGVHLTVAGEAYLIGLPAPEDDPEADEWRVVSTQEITSTGGAWSLVDSNGHRESLPDSAAIIRIWRPHPRRRHDADAPVRACLPVLRELEQLTKHVAAQIDSRLAGAGILLVPSEMTFAGTSSSVSTGDDSPRPRIADADAFVAELAEAMITPIENRDDPSSVVPIVLKAPGATLDATKLLTFWSPLDDAAMSLRTEAIRRLALGMDMPPEVLLGTGGVNHWGAWQIEESAIKIHVEPVLTLVANAITTAYLRPLLAEAGVDDVDSYVVHWDTAALRLRPNRSSEAVELYDRGELDGDALRRETGFTNEDKPDPTEFTQWLLRRLATSNPDLAIQALGALGITLAPGSAPLDGEAVDRGGRPIERPAIPTAPTNPVAPTPTSPAARRGRPGTSPSSGDLTPVATVDPVVAAAEVIVFRALERATNRLRHARGGTAAAVDVWAGKACGARDPDALLAGAWDCVEQFAPSLGVPPEWLTDRLHTYARTLLADGAAHDPCTLAAALDRPCPPEHQRVLALA